jgi:hypothetical protein
MFSCFGARPVHINVGTTDDLQNFKRGATLEILVADIAATNESDFASFHE